MRRSGERGYQVNPSGPLLSPGSGSEDGDASDDVPLTTEVKAEAEGMRLVRRTAGSARRAASNAPGPGAGTATIPGGDVAPLLSLK